VLKIRLSFLSRFLFSVMVPLNLKHPDCFSSCASHFSIQYFDRMFNIRYVWLDFDGLEIDDLGRDFDSFLKLRYMEDIMNGC
jgi:hypothetical protein